MHIGCHLRCSQVWVVNGIPRIGIFASRDISKGEAYSFKYLDMEKKKCCCAKCSAAETAARVPKRPRETLNDEAAPGILAAAQPAAVAGQPRLNKVIKTTPG